MLSKAEIVAALHSIPKMIPVMVLEWGGEVFVRLLSEAEVESLGNNTKLARSRFAVLAVCNESGERLFTDADAEMLANSPGHFSALEKIWNEGTRFNGIIRDEGDSKN